MRRVGLCVLGLLLLGVLCVTRGCTTVQRLGLPVAEAMAPAAVFRLPATDGPPFVVLTIDDAPSSVTPAILDLLATYEAKATFFVHTDQIIDEARRAALARAVAEGHDLAHHMPADARSDQLSPPEFLAAFAKADRVLGGFGSGHLRAFRPPHGRYDANMMDPVLASFGYDAPLTTIGGGGRYILASFIPWDAKKGATDTEDVAKNEKAARRYGDQMGRAIFPGAIVVFHDGEEDGRRRRAAATLVSLDVFLRHAARREFEVVSLSAAMSPGRAGP